MFRRRRRDETDPAARDSSEEEYLAADELAEHEDYQEDEDYQEEEDDEDYLEDEDEAADGDFESAALASADDHELAADPGYEPAAEPGADDSGQSGREDLGDPATWTRLRDTAAAEPANVRSAGPWDAAGGYPDADRVDFGCMLVPVRDGSDVQISLSEETGVMIGVVSADSLLQLQAFAAPRSTGLWHEVRPEIAEEVAKAGGRSQHQDGLFGPELLAWINPGPDAPAGLPPQPLRFLGVDGPRWFLRGMISGPAAVDAELARPLEAAFADVVVVRGDHAEPPRKPLEIQLPEQAQQLFEAQVEAEQEGSSYPFERGPEITETR